MLLKAVGVDAGQGNGWFGIVGFVNRKLRVFATVADLAHQ